MNPTDAHPLMVELILRGAAAGVNLLFAIRIVTRTPAFGVANLGALFTFATACYVIVSSPAAEEFGPLWTRVLAVFATFNSVFFWWFATALFDDDFRWRWWRFVPLGVIAMIYGWRFLGAAGNRSGDDMIQQVVVIAMMLHAIWLAIAHRGDDLVELRRRFRLIFAGFVGLTGLVIALVELVLAGRTPPPGLSLFHAFAVLALSLAFASWVISRIEIFANPTQSVAPVRTATIDDAARMRLTAAMEAGAFRTEGLTIAALADQIAYPEYKLRQLINGALGFRNFSAFLNSYRLQEAKRLLADPTNARKQITQIALDLGYGSIAPFNRAFKNDEGVTPSAFRKAALISAAQVERSDSDGSAKH